MANADCNTPNPARSPSISKRKKAFRFVPSSDIMLLKEALKHRPWAAIHGETLAAWTSVATGLKVALTSCAADDKACLPSPLQYAPGGISPRRARLVESVGFCRRLRGA
ncbi:hypothetical protein PPTG_03791 [Phytophthora nicotianae INRA-310]|uniref:Uncharacterized protein n=4 Tax=Phytophthora nicotianae TaxID=4792 RepID=W2R025_PHYN3|nr:hypothetical protein PPTG_03791 [Phytophthora nicotianae INRA-310]ETI36580.1 hypothetical protein F443_17327 [Phytophthora nicotianae P1569]ETM36681.1 hypothetical protein L914_16681 [Phytophthora nicotianae]ETN18079.1 hypothetical protein PPTG_03791 [Phytophthora nicotianae INRA-310]ETO65311.1 hypothetical protein F444_17359 [Phytophthora nicotianae P1976]